MLLQWEAVGVGITYYPSAATMPYKGVCVDYTMLCRGEAGQSNQVVCWYICLSDQKNL